MKALSDVAAMLVSSDDPEAIVQSAGDNIMPLLGADVFFNYVLDPGAERLRLNACGGVDKRIAKMIERLELGQAICGCVARDGERIISEDVQNNGDPLADLVRHMGVRCYVCHPLKVGDETIGTLSFGTKSRDSFDAEEIELMQTLANQFAVAMERVRNKRVFGFQSFLLESVVDSVFVYYPDEPHKGQILYANEAACATRGYTREEMVRLNIMDVIAPEWRSVLQPRLDELAAGETVCGESAHVCKDGSVFPVEVRLRQVDFGERPFVVNVTRDISDRKRDEERIRKAFDAERAELTRTRLLQDVAQTAGSVLELEPLAIRVLDALQQHVGLQAGDVRLLSPEGECLRLLASVGWSPETRERLAELPVADSAWMASRVFATNRALTHEDEGTPTPQRRKLLKEIGVMDSRYIALPLTHADVTLGIMSLTFKGRRPFTPQERDLFGAVAKGVAQAVRNARLYEAERANRAREEALKAVAQVAASSLEPEELATRICETLAGLFDAKQTQIRLLDKTGTKLVDAGAYDPDGFLQTIGAMPIDAETETATTFRTAERRVASRIPTSVSQESKQNAADAGVSAYALLPVIVAGRTIGTLYLAWSEPRDFTDEELSFLDAATAQFSTGLQNARIYEAERDIADRLQEALLSVPDEIRGIEFARAYHSATEAARVGGDFYDVFELSEDHVGLIIGDVAGKGIDAAVLTSMVKNTIRAHANERGKTPAQVLDLANDVICKSTGSATFVTVFFGILDLRDGRIVFANAGHTTAAMIGNDGVVGSLAVTGPILGAFADVQWQEAEAFLEPGGLLFLYTDGLTEARINGELYGEERLFRYLETTGDMHPEEVVEAVIADVLAFSGGGLRDDLAILAVRRGEPPGGIPHQQKLEL